MPTFADRYSTKTWLGQGGMGDIWKCYDKDGVPFAVKTARDLGQSKVVQREGEILERLKHPNIVRCGKVFYDSFEMHFMSGSTLDEIMKDIGKMKERYAIEIIQLMCKAVNYSNNLGIIHRDIKPDNIFITDTGEVKLFDFGIAIDRKRSRSHADPVNHVFEPLADPRLQDPNFVADAQVDVFALGVTLYKLVTGRNIMFGDRETILVQMKAHLDQVRPPSDFGVSKKLSDVIMKAISPATFVRYESAAELGKALAKAK